jgi:nickel/cobalt exporter
MNLPAIIEQGNANPLFLLSAALVLGALHGLEPGHSKTMMAAFIIAVRGTVPQAILLGVAAAFSHSIIVWVLGLLALTYGDEMIAEEMEPWFMIGSGTIVIAIAAWIFLQTRRTRPKGHEHADARHRHHTHEHAHHHRDLAHDAHARLHATEIERRFAAGQASNWQILGFGLTGGLIPCPAAVTVLIVCLHLQQFWLGVGLVGSFSAGLALTLVAVGVAAAWGVSVAARKTSRFNALFAKAPYISAILIAAVGVLMLVSGVAHMG